MKKLEALRLAHEINQDYPGKIIAEVVVIDQAAGECRIELEMLLRGGLFTHAQSVGALESLLQAWQVLVEDSPPLAPERIPEIRRQRAARREAAKALEAPKKTTVTPELVEAVQRLYGRPYQPYMTGRNQQGISIKEVSRQIGISSALALKILKKEISYE